MIPRAKTDFDPRLLLFTLGLSWSLSACLGSGSSPDEKVCTAIFAYGATVSVSEMGSGTPITDATLAAVSLEGETAQPFVSLGDESPGIYLGLGEAPGTWTLTVSAPGFQSDSQTFTLVQDTDGCHVVGQSFTFELVRLPD